MTTIFEQAQRYVGTPYVAREFDCLDLAVLVQRELFGLEVMIPSHQARPGGSRGQGREILRYRDMKAERTELPVDGCGVLLWEPEGEAGQDLRLWHIGTAFLHGGEVWVLHNSAHLGSAALHRLVDLRRFGMRLDGFYIWRAAA